MAKKPLIGITCNYDYRDTLGLRSGVGTCGQDWNYVAGDYVYAIEKAGGVPVLLPQCSDIEYLKPLLDLLDGIIISGGHDVGPENYGAFTKTCCKLSPVDTHKLFFLKNSQCFFIKLLFTSVISIN